MSDPSLEPIGYDIVGPDIGFVSSARASDPALMAKVIDAAEADGVAMTAPAPWTPASP